MSALRAAVAALMATGETGEGLPWWGYWSAGLICCNACLAPGEHRQEDVDHDPDCAAMAVEAAMKGEGQ